MMENVISESRAEKAEKVLNEKLEIDKKYVWQMVDGASGVRSYPIIETPVEAAEIIKKLDLFCREADDDDESQAVRPMVLLIGKVSDNKEVSYCCWPLMYTDNFVDVVEKAVANANQIQEA